MDDIYSCIASNKMLLAQAPTGSGKTDASLSAAITYAMENDLTVFFLTPKISQHRIAMEVVQGIAKKHKLDLRAVDLVGRKNSCLEESMLELDADAFYQTCEKKRKKNQCIYHQRAKGSGRFEEIKADFLFKKMLKQYGSGKNHEKLMALALKNRACPYEWMLKLGSVSNVIIADYLHFMMPDIRASLMQKMKKDIERTIVIVDEAHNLGKRVRENLSISLNSYIMRRAEKELQSMQLLDEPFADNFDSWARERLKDTQEKVVSPLGFNNFIAALGGDVDETIAWLGEAGLQFIEQTGKKSACIRLAKFMAFWDSGDEECVRILRRKGEFFSLSKRFLDPSRATGILNSTVSAILMSGTLAPLEMHKDVLGLDSKRTVMKEYPSPFDKDNIVNLIAQGITTKYSKRDENNYKTIARKIDDIVLGTPGGTAVFFPSYGVMKHVVPIMQSKNMIVQNDSMRPSEVKELIDEFSRKQGVLVGVQGGSLAEGVDFSKGEIKTAVIVGIALDEMNLETEALIDYYQDKYGKGWEYGYLYPGTIKALQAAGRGRRKESDQVAVVYMDERFKWKKYNWIFNRDERTILTPRPEHYVKAFWEEKGNI